MTTTFDLQQFLKTLPALPGVYQMLNRDGIVIYVGKARRLKQRVRSYFQKSHPDAKTRALVRQIASINITVTHSEQEALLLENNLIKKLLPKYNVIFRDDKSYPYIHIRPHQNYASLEYYRGDMHEPGDYFGPYPSASAVHEALKLMQHLFRLRPCSDGFFNHRTRPCLEYQIKRCTAPCVNLISKELYQQDVADAKLFLAGKKTQILKTLAKRMEKAAEAMDYETAARYRDAIVQLRRMQEQQYVMRSKGEVDVIAVAIQAQVACVQLLQIRKGQLLGTRAYFPEHSEGVTEVELLDSFLTQHYLASVNELNIPKKIITNLILPDKRLLQNTLAEISKHRVTMIDHPQGDDLTWLKMTKTNLDQSLRSHLSSQVQELSRLENLQNALNLPELPLRMECFDISHSSGEATVASCVVFQRGVPAKMHYRRFNIKDITPGDDYAALAQAVTRHFTRIKTNGKSLPDILFIDGGKGQLSQIMTVLEELQLTQMTVIAIAKGEGRKAGLERLFTPQQELPIILPPESPALHLIQQIRDEAHRFAISAHRKQRSKKRVTSILQQIPNIGEKRRRALLHHFGGLQEINQASAEELAKVTGISTELAQQIYTFLREKQ